MANKSDFTDDEWRTLTEAPLWITLALVAVGEHGPISVVKEAAASAREMAHPSEHGPADQLIAQLAREAESREARHDVQAHRGRSTAEIVDGALADLALANTALAKLAPDEASEVRTWLTNIAKAVAGAAKSVSADEQAVMDKIASLLRGSTS